MLFQQTMIPMTANCTTTFPNGPYHQITLVFLSLGKGYYFWVFAHCRKKETCVKSLKITMNTVRTIAAMINSLFNC